MVGIPPVSDKMLEDGIGYVKVDALTKGKAQEMPQRSSRSKNPARRNWSSICAIPLTETRAKELPPPIFS